MDDDEKTTESVPDSGGLGGGSRDTHLVERAVKQRWNIPENLRSAVPRVMARILANKESSPRNKIAASRVILAADALNMDQEKRDAGETGGSSVHVNVNVLPTPIIRIIEPAPVLEVFNHANGHT